MPSSVSVLAIGDIIGRPGRQAMAVTPDGSFYFTNWTRQLVRIRAADGAVPEPFGINGIILKWTVPLHPVLVARSGARRFRFFQW